MANLKIDFLDVSATKYGDCILVRGAGKTILIDGAHQGDMKNKDGFVSIPNQLDTLLGGARPHVIDLLVVTHAHSDHIGCLPDLVSQNVITCRKAYVADEALGWGEIGIDAVADPRVAAAWDVLREEGAESMSGAELDAAITDGESLRTRYHTMLETLDQQGAVIACDGDENRAAIENEFSELGLKILGPTKDHLKTCASLLEQIGRDFIEALSDAANQDAAAPVSDLVRRVMDEGDDGPLLDMAGAGAALNNQSIVLMLKHGNRKVLLAGDMQFAEPEVPGLDDDMADLRAVVRQNGPYDIVKSSHHTSYNGWDDTVAAEQLIRTRSVWVVHSGGRNDPKHPDSGALSAIKKLRKNYPKPFSFLRTDRNGQINVNITGSGTITVDKQKGKVNTFTANSDLPEEFAVAVTESEVQPEVTSGGGERVEVTARIPHARTKVTITVSVDPGAAETVLTTEETPATAEDPRVRFALPSDRQLPKLLFVTDQAALGRKIGAEHARSLIRTLRDGGQDVVDAVGNRTPRALANAYRQRIEDAEGVVLVGDVDVVPSQRLDVLSPQLRSALDDPSDDPDSFIVWNDEVYGDINGNNIPERPVSRIPDGGSATVLARALGAAGPGATSRFGIRNVRRPFAQEVFKKVSQTALRISQPTRHTDVRASEVASDLVYFMLHGDDTDTQRFWGESGAGALEAFSVAQVPPRFAGVVFSGCCWGALTPKKKAVDAAQNEKVGGRSARESVAVSFIAAGAQAFVGCTGVHYSPPGNTTTSAGAPMHVAFFKQLSAGHAPARALFLAKQDCIKALKDPAPSAEERAIDLKVIRQFQCLGLGW